MLAFIKAHILYCWYIITNPEAKSVTDSGPGEEVMAKDARTREEEEQEEANNQ